MPLCFSKASPRGGGGKRRAEENVGVTGEEGEGEERRVGEGGGKGMREEGSGRDGSRQE